MADLFKDVLPSIMQTKVPVVAEENEKDYVPFVVNKALSYHFDCILYANEMNQLSNTDKLLQYHYMLNSIRGYKRKFQKWQKLTPSEDLEAVKQYFNYSTEKAKEALTVLSADQLEEIKRKLDRGGVNDKSKRTSGGDTKRAR